MEIVCCSYPLEKLRDVFDEKLEFDIREAEYDLDDIDYFC